jgi:hypothetical protein
VINIKTLLIAAAVSTGIALVVPAASQAMPQSAPVKMQAANDGKLVQVNHKKKWHKKKWRKNKWRESRRWRHKRWARYCDPWDGCYRRRHAYYYPHWYGPYPYYYGYGPGFYGPGIGLHFRFD